MPVPVPMLKSLERRLAREYGGQRELGPFRVGADWLSDLDHSLTDPDDLDGLLRVAEELAADSDRLYYPSSETPPIQRTGRMIRFQSRGRTDHAPNATAYLGYSPLASGCPMVLVIPAWNAPRRAFRKLLPFARASQFGGAVLTLPYHDKRQPAEWTHAEGMVCADLGLTLRAMQQAVLDTMDAISILQSLGHEHIIILGFSIGSGISILVDAHDPRPAGIISIFCADRFADCAWNGISTESLRRELEKHIDLDTLRRAWRPMEFGCFVPRLARHDRVVRALLTARNDHTFPQVNALRFRAIYEREQIEHTWKSMACGHYTLQYPPAAYTFALWLRRRLLEASARIRMMTSSDPANGSPAQEPVTGDLSPKGSLNDGQ